MSKSLITFEVGGEIFGIDSMAIVEIRAWSAASSLPGAPDYVVGVVNRRGVAMPVIDLAIRLGWQPADISMHHAIVVIQIDEQEVGLIVEAVSDMVSVDLEALQPPPSFDHPASLPFIESLVAIEDRLVMILDPRALDSSLTPARIDARP